ncbi:hypothetical protein [Streptomyces sp. NPDC001652]|uniref:hypothetical protein n=1 Tax=Streptomyces sp. NPDC001652 TaxID=3154393 RepID=UPI0033171C6E
MIQASHTVTSAPDPSNNFKSIPVARSAAAPLDACPELDQTHQLVRAFTQMPARRTGADLPDWISTARAAPPWPLRFLTVSHRVYAA